MKLWVTLGGRELTVEVQEEGGAAPRIDGAPVAADLRRLGPGLYSVLLDGRSYEVTLDGEAPDQVDVDGRTLALRVQDGRRLAAGAGVAGTAAGPSGGVLTVAAPMPGRVAAVPVSPGDEVERGQTVIVLEAMKMESALGAPHAGRVTEVLVSPGQTVQQRQPLVRIDG